MRILTTIGLGLILCGVFIIIGVVAVEPAQRNIVYIHVPAAICSLVCFCVLFVCSIQYLRKKIAAWDYAAAASAQAGFVFATLMNLSGMIFAYVEWGVWWTASPRLVSSAVLWFLYAAYLILRASFEGQNRRGKISAAFGIIAFADVPMVIISARFIRDIHRPNFTFESGWQSAAMIVAIAGTLCLAAAFIRLRTRTLSKTKPSALQL